MPAAAPTDRFRSVLKGLAGAALLALGLQAGATDFSVSPILATLKPGALSETITVTNHAKQRLRVGIRLMAWTQDENGKDVYTDSAELVYFPRQLDIDGESKKIVRIGMKTPPGPTERAYRLYVEEMPDPLGTTARAAVNFSFRFGVPIFVAPAASRDGFQMDEPTWDKGKLVVPVRNEGNQHARVNRLTITDGAGYSQSVTGWYSLAGTARSYTADIPAEACRKAKDLTVTAEGEGLRVERQVHVDPANCP